MGKVFGCLTLFVVVCAILIWPVPSLVVLGVLLVVGHVHRSKAGSRAATAATQTQEKQQTSVITTKEKKEAPVQPAQPKSQVGRCSGKAFERRMYRARTEPFKIVALYGNEKAEADILSVGSGNVYRVSLIACECEDFKKGNSPCKHMIYFALHTGRYEQMEKPIPRYEYTNTNREGRMVPLYWDYATRPTGVGYTNLYPYEVCGRVLGMSKKTGRQTNRKKTIIVNAASESDAETAAQTLGCMPPYTSVEIIDSVPSEAQYGYLYGAEIPFPNLANSYDVGALLTRYEDENDNKCPKYLFKMATKYRVRVSLFQEPESVITCIWESVPDEKKAAMFCYAVYCREKGYPFGNAPIESDASAFADFEPTKKQLAYILGIREFGWSKLNKQTTTYQSARGYLARRNIF